MVYAGYLIIVNVQNIKKKSVLKISIFELPRVENCTSRIVLACCHCSANVTTAECCLEFTTRGSY